MTWEDAAVTEVGEHLWRLVGKAKPANSDPWSAFSDIANLHADDAILRSRLAVLRLIDIDDFISSFETVVRGLPSSIDFRTSVDSRGPYGRIRWAQTAVTRTRSGNPELVVHSQVIRDHDRPLNRAVKSALNAFVEILDAARRAGGLFGEQAVHEFLRETRGALDDLLSRALALLANPKIAGARTIESASEEQWERLVERGAHECLLDPAFQQAFTVDPTLQDVIDVLVNDLTQPSRLSDLMELMIGVRLSRALEQFGLRLLPLRLRRPRQPFARLVAESGAEWEVYWQSSPWVVPTLGWDRESSVYHSVRLSNGLSETSVLRPDCLVVGPDKRAVLVEVKFTEGDEPRYRDAILDAMAYLLDTEAHASPSPGPRVIAAVRHATAEWDGESPIAVSDGELTSLTRFLGHFWADVLTPRSPSELACA